MSEIIKSKFIVVEHKAVRAGKHQDLRFRKPKGKLWDSFAVRKGVPLKPGVKVLAMKTHDHTEKDAVTTKEIKSGYGKGTYKKIDGGQCEIEKYTPSHIAVVFKGSKVKGLYHLVNAGVMRSKDNYKEQKWLLFKGKIQK